MGKGKVLNESVLTQVRLPEEGKLLGRALKLLDSEDWLKNNDNLPRDF